MYACVLELVWSYFMLDAALVVVITAAIESLSASYVGIYFEFLTMNSISYLAGVIMLRYGI